MPSAFRAGLAALQQRRARNRSEGHVAPAPRGGPARPCRFPAATSSTLGARLEVHRLAQLLADDLQRGTDDGRNCPTTRPPCCLVLIAAKSGAGIMLGAGGGGGQLGWPCVLHSWVMRPQGATALNQNMPPGLDLKTLTRG